MISRGGAKWGKTVGRSGAGTVETWRRRPRGPTRCVCGHKKCAPMMGALSQIGGAGGSVIVEPLIEVLLHASRETGGTGFPRTPLRCSTAFDAKSGARGGATCSQHPNPRAEHREEAEDGKNDEPHRLLCQRHSAHEQDKTNHNDGDPTQVKARTRTAKTAHRCDLRPKLRIIRHQGLLDFAECLLLLLRKRHGEILLLDRVLHRSVPTPPQFPAAAGPIILYNAQRSQKVPNPRWLQHSPPNLSAFSQGKVSD